MPKTQEKNMDQVRPLNNDLTDTIILEKLSSIHADIEASKDKLKSEIQGVKSELSEVTKSLNAVWEKCNHLNRRTKTYKTSAIRLPEKIAN